MPDIFIKEYLENIMPNEIRKIIEIATLYKVSLTSLLCKYIDVSYENIALIYYENNIVKWSYYDYDTFDYHINNCNLDKSLVISSYQEDYSKKYIKEDIDNKVFLSAFEINENEKIILLHVKYLES